MAENPQAPRAVRVPLKPAEDEATSVECYKCWNCGLEYPTGGKAQGRCPTCGQTCTRDRCQVVFTSNEGY